MAEAQAKREVTLFPLKKNKFKKLRRLAQRIVLYSGLFLRICLRVLR